LIEFAEVLFDSVWANLRKPLLDSPAAAGDRLQTCAKQVKRKALANCLQPIGAAFQNTFAAIVIAINEAASRFGKVF
jgi:hypothetical protein